MEKDSEYLKYIKESFELKNRRLYKEAIESLYKVLGEDIDDNSAIEIISQIGDLHILLNNYDRAKEQFEHVLEINPNHLHSKNRLFNICFELGEYKKAAQLAYSILEISKQPEDYVKLFSSLLKLKEFNKILEIYSSLDDTTKNDANLLYLVSFIDVTNQKELLFKAIEASPTFVEPKFDLAMIYMDEDNNSEAERLFDDILKIREHALSYYYKGVFQADRGEYFPAINNFHRAIKISKGMVEDFYFELAKAYMEINWYDEAINTSKLAITLCNKKSAPRAYIDKLYLLMSWVFEKKNDYDNALFNLKLIDSASPLSAECQILKGVIEYKKGNLSEAKTILENIYSQYPKYQTDLTLLHTLGAIYRDLSLNFKAKEFFEIVLKLNPKSIYTVLEFVDLLIDLKEYDRAQKLIENYSDGTVIPGFMNSLARIYYRKEEFNKALETLNRLLDADKNNAEAYYFKGLILNRTGKYKEALHCIEDALSLNPTKAKYYAQASVANMELGAFEDAMLYIKEAIEIEPEEINFKKQAATIADKSGNKQLHDFWNSIVTNSEKILRSIKKSG